MVNKISQYIHDSIRELKKVIWPTRKEITQKTMQVIFLSIFVSLFLGIVDFLLTKVLEKAVF